MKRKIKISLGSILFSSTFLGLGIVGIGSAWHFSQSNNDLQQSNLNSQYLEDEELNFDKIAQVEGGHNHSAALTTEGEVYTWGDDQFGQLGNGLDKTNGIHSPEKISFEEDVKIKQITLGYEYSAALSTDGEVYTWGDDQFGQLGNGPDKSDNVHSPEKISFGEDVEIEKISLGTSHSAALTTEGEVYTWGNNSDSQLGLGENAPNPVLSPTKIEEFIDLNDDEMVSEISMGEYHSAAVTTEGNVYTWGINNSDGILGNEDILDIVPTPTKIRFEEGVRILQIDLASRHSSALTTEGEVYTWGAKANGILGDGTQGKGSSTTSPKKIYFVDLKAGDEINSINIGRKSSSAVTTEGEVYTWGNNRYGKLGNGTFLGNVLTPTKISFEEGVKIKEVVMNEQHSVGLTDESEIYTWGDDSFGKLGNGPEKQKNVLLPEKIFFPAYFYETAFGNHSTSYSTDGMKLSIDLKVGNSDRNIDGSLREDLSLFLEVVDRTDESNVIYSEENELTEAISYNGATITFTIPYEDLLVNTTYDYRYTLCDSSNTELISIDSTFNTGFIEDLMTADITIESDNFDNSNAFIEHTYHYPNISSGWINSIHYNVLYKDGKTQLLDIDLNQYEPLIVQEHNFELEQSVSNAESYTIVAKLKNDESIELDKDKIIFEKVKFIEPSIPINPSLPSTSPLQSSGLVWWAWLLISLGIASVGIVLVGLILKKRKIN